MKNTRKINKTYHTENKQKTRVSPEGAAKRLLQ